MRAFNLIQANFKLLTPDSKLPYKAHPTDAGMDIFSIEDVVIPAGGGGIVSTGIAWQPEFTEIFKTLYAEISNSFLIYMLLWPRSGLSCKNNIEVGAGLIDENFRGEIKVHLYNLGNKDYEIKKGDKIVQGIVDMAPQVGISAVEVLKDTDRGSNGFGSTGN